MNISKILKSDATYPSNLKRYLTEDAPKSFSFIGNLDILKKKTLAVFCSVKCPGNLILKTYDLAKQLREAGGTVISGFHSPMEKECLNILLRGKQPVIISPARSIEGMRIKEEYKKILKEGRLLIISPFDKKENRISLKRSAERNLFVAAIADSIVVTYAAPQSKTEEFCREIISWEKPVYTFEDEANANLISLGAKPLNPSTISNSEKAFLF